MMLRGFENGVRASSGWGLGTLRPWWRRRQATINGVQGAHVLMLSEATCRLTEHATFEWAL